MSACDGGAQTNNNEGGGTTSSGDGGEGGVTSRKLTLEISLAEATAALPTLKAQTATCSVEARASCWGVRDKVFACTPRDPIVCEGPITCDVTDEGFPSSGACVVLVTIKNEGVESFFVGAFESTGDAVKVDGKPVDAVMALSVLGSYSNGKAVCSDGIVEPGEVCDDGKNNGDSPNTCRADCLIPPYCGDRICDNRTRADRLYPTEDCNTCSEDCGECPAIPNTCGNGSVEPGEDCDDGDLSSDATCTSDCHYTCGDGICHEDHCEINRPGCYPTETHESCPADCHANCGNGTVEGPEEQCDDGNAVDTDACRNTCVAAACGDGVVLAQFEQCDDGNTISDDGCSSTCQTEGVTDCGNSSVEGTEQCDPGSEYYGYYDTSCPADDPQNPNGWGKLCTSPAMFNDCVVYYADPGRLGTVEDAQLFCSGTSDTTGNWLCGGGTCSPCNCINEF